VNCGDGTLGALVNDPRLYRNVNGSSGSSGWLLGFCRGIRSLAFRDTPPSKPPTTP
jgi:hypothetical protein